ncbi:MAG: NAD-dependent malic enzyme [Arthrobacter sp.]|nr:NAD-dependent malic enzyme [Arthrobacter sp.]
MANPSPGNSITLRVEAPSSFTATSELAAAVAVAGAAMTALDVTESHHGTLVVDVSCNTTDDDHAARVKDALNALDGVTVRNVSDRTFLMHPGGKLEVVPKVALRNRDDLSRAYTPGVARVCLAIAGGVNLEDIAAPRCFEIEDRLRECQLHHSERFRPPCCRRCRGGRSLRRPAGGYRRRYRPGAAPAPAHA